MRKNYDDVYLNYLHSLACEPYTLNMLGRAVKDVAELYHICGVEAELVGSFNVGPNEKDLLIFESSDIIPAGEPLRFSYHISEHRNILIYIYPGVRSFDRDERKELEFFAAGMVFYLELIYLENTVFNVYSRQEISGVLNSSGYLYRVAELIKRDIPLSLYSAFYFNLKDFGDINRRYGREIGDQLLKYYAKMLEGLAGRDEIIGHLGGDNFMALIKKDGRRKFIDHISDATIAMPLDETIEEFKISATIGVWDITTDVSDPGEVISRPSIALNQARNVLHQSIVSASDNLITQLSEQRSLLKVFDEALKAEEFAVYYQPKVDSRTGLLTGAEGLVRWFRKGRMISPGVFIPALEENGKSIKLDCYVLKRVCSDIMKWKSAGLDPVTVSVNFSRKDLKDRRLSERINSIIEESGIDKRLIEIELTESVDTEEHGVLTDFIKRLYDLDIMTAIDDFGSGYSSLSTLREFQLHTLKLDRSFVNTDDFSWKDEIILRDIIHMAEELSMEVLCEGVERADQLALLNSVGCYIIQGFYYDRPLPREEFEKRLRDRRYIR
ncbi:MAG TPA: hypothetical protein DCL38_08955 [Lachnospiraceae bacterium]|nr:hypothetical protein [Lachnospiraceae bacterium]